MRRLSAIAALIFFGAIFPLISFAQEQPSWEAWTLSQIIPGTPAGSVDFDFVGDTVTGTNGICVKYGESVLMADSATVNRLTGETVADGHVRIEEGDQIWVGEHIRYNFKTHQMQSEQFRMGRPPVFAQGGQLQGDTTNKTYHARHAFVTTDDVTDPAICIRSSHIKIVPGKYVEMWNAVLFMDGVPVFYFPYYRRNLGEHANNFNFTPGYRSAYGPFLLNTYTWYLGDAVDGKIRLDYREKRGVGAGPDLNLVLGQWGEADFKYYYLHDQHPNNSTGTNSFANLGVIPENRQRFSLEYQATPFTNLNLKALVNYQSDPLVLHDFFEGDYTANPQPNTFIEVNKYWNNWSLDAETTPRVNNFFDQVERLPDVKLTGYRQQIFDTPLYYESESSAGYYQRFFAATNNNLFSATNSPPAYSAARADTFHQLLLPCTFFGWLNVTPHVGGRFTWYSQESGPGGTNDETDRAVFNTGVGTSFKVSQLWAGATNSLLDIDGLRHILEPSVNYVFVPRPTAPLSQLPQFDSASPSLLLLPIQFPDYDNIDSIDSQNVIRFGLRNTLQTKRGGQLDDLLDWNVALDWRLTPGRDQNNLDEPFSGQKTFSDLYSDLVFRPRKWIALESQLRYDINSGDLNLAFHQLTLTPNERWSWGIGHWYLRSGFDGFTQSDNFITSTFFYRLNDNWGFRTRHDFNAENGRLQQQLYTIYRDLRSWTGALTFRVVDNGNGPTDFTVAFTFSLKAVPKTQVGGDTVQHAYHLVGE
jgi:lipopolysaccharide assembly outer membrane protein LptD (OstA)